MDGIVNVLKPVGMTSTDVVRWLHRKTRADKAGHIGTLDPGAAGVLPICLGKATRLAEYHTDQGKYYRAEITLGIATDTQDAFGQETQRMIPQVSQQEFINVLEKFTGSIEQLPPMYSAVKKKGKPLYAYARQGVEIEREPRFVNIQKLELIEWNHEPFPRALIDIECSKGTYIRTLCHDIGKTLGCGAHMSFLLRIRAGKFTLDSSYTLEDIERALLANTHYFLSDIDYGLELPEVTLVPTRLRAFRSGLSTGGSMVIGDIPEDNRPVKVYGEGRFVGVGMFRDGCLCPTKVIS
jgi:tRNA pseudouridine55 synthase